MISRFFWVVTALFLTFAFRTNAQVNDLPYNKIEALVEIRGDAPYVGEPLRLVIRSAFHAPVANDRIIQPDLTDFDWQQFGVDSTSEELIEGFWMPVITRVLMIYPLRPGKLTINSFKRLVTYFNSHGERTETEISSQPVSIDVRSHESLAGNDTYWIPAKNLRITDQWSPEPDNIKVEETAQRTITIEADGLTADRLPNLPSFRAPGIITFAGPVQRETIITDEGPLGRIVYRWRIRPVSQSVAITPSVKIRWFDVSNRQMREAVIPERRVAFVSSSQERKSSQGIKFSNLLSFWPILAFLLSFLMMSAIGYLFVSFQLNDMTFWRVLFVSFGLFALLALSAWRDDQLKFYSIITKLRKTDPLTWGMIESDVRYSGLVNNLEATIYGDRPASRPGKLINFALTIFIIFVRTQLGHKHFKSSKSSIY